MIYFVNAAGEIITVCGAATSEQQEQAAAAGLFAVEAAEFYDREAVIYQNGAFVARSTSGASPSLAEAASAKRLALARQVEEFISTLTAGELALVRQTDPSRTNERYPAYWLQWAGGQNDIAQLVAAHASASAEQRARAETVRLNYMALVTWCSRITVGPLATAYSALAVAVAASDVAAVEAIALDLSAHQIGAIGEDADPDPDVTQAMLNLTPEDLALLAQA